MKKKEQSFISDLLSKLQAAYSAPSKKDPSKSKKKKSDAADQELEDKLREVLSEVTPTPTAKSKKSASAKKDTPISHELPTEEPVIEDVPTAEEEQKPSTQTEIGKPEAKAPISEETEPSKAPVPHSARKEKPQKAEKASKASKKEEPLSTSSEEKSKTEDTSTTDIDFLDQKEASSTTKAPLSKEQIEVVSSEETPEEETVEPILPVKQRKGKTSSKKEEKAEDTSTTSIKKEHKKQPSRSTNAKNEEQIPSAFTVEPTEAEDLPPQEEPIAPIEEAPLPPKTIEQTAPSVEQAVEPTVEPTVEQTVEQMTEQTIKPSAETPISKAPIQEARKEKPTAQTAPIRIVPRSTVTSSTASTEQASVKAASEPIVIRPKEYSSEAPMRQKSDAIVIRPTAAAHGKQEATVIRPRPIDQTPSPTPIEPEQTSKEPIRIGKKVDEDMNNNTQTPKQNHEAPPKPTEVTREPTVTMIPHDTRFSASSTPKTSPKKAPDVTVVPQDDRFAVKGQAEKPSTQASAPSAPQKGAPSAKAPAKKAPAAPHKTLISTSPLSARTTSKALHPTKKKDPPAPMPKLSPEDEALDEVLDEVPQQGFSENSATIISQDHAEPETNAQDTHEEQDLSAHSEEARALYREVYEKSGLTEDDIIMMFELGYENELGRVVGYNNLKKLKYEHLRLISKTHRKHYRTAFGYRGVEYGGAQDREKVLAAYHKDRIYLILRTVATALLTLLLFFVDMPEIIGSSFTALLSSHELISPALSLGLLLVCALISIRQINAGIRQFYKFAPTPYSVCAIVLPFAIAYDILAFFFALPSLGFVFALSLLMTVLCDVLRMSCELRAFHIVSAEGRKTVLESAAPRKKKLRQGEKIVKIISDDAGEISYRVRTAEQTVGFFRRFNSMDSAAKPFTVLLLTMLGASTASAFVMAVITLSLTEAVRAFMTVLAVCAPVSAIFSYFYPLFRANRLLSHRNCTIVGEEGVEDYDREKTVIFDDVDFLVAKKHTEKVLREDYDLSRDRRLAECLFQKLGGTLGQIAPNASKLHQDTPVSILRVTDGGVEAMIESKYHILAGKEKFLRRNGIKIPKESSDSELRRASNVSLMYVAIDGVLKLSYEIEYTTRPEFEEKISELSFYDTTVGIHTYDPNLTEEFLNAMRHEENESVRVIRPGRYEEDPHMEVLDTGAVSIGSPENITSILYTATGIGTSRRFGLRIQLIASLIGCVLATLLMIWKQDTLLGILPITAYQLFWVLISFIATHSELNRSALRLD